MTTISIYDFDHTIYDGDASVDFIIYTLKRRVWLWKYLPQQCVAIIYLIFGLQPRKNIKEKVFRFLKDIRNIDDLVDHFWQSHERKLKPWYLHNKKSDDIIVSASPEFLLRPITTKLGVTLLATRMDERTGKIEGQNCRGSEKVRRLEEYDSKLEVAEVYSDSLSDRPLFEKAKKAYVVSGDKIIPFEEYKPSKLKQLMTPAFIRFLFAGGVNAFLGILFAYIISLFLTSALLAFVLGYLLGLICSYFINSVITFQNFNFGFKKFISFCISYIPNFLILVVCVYLLVDVLNVYNLIAYILAVVIAVPITFLLLSNRTFKDSVS